MSDNTHATATDLLDKTMATLAGGLSATDTQSGAEALNQWIAMLQAGENTSGLTDAMGTLKTQLSGKQPDPSVLRDLLTQLADQTREFSSTLGAEGDLAPRLEALSSTLRAAAGQL
jgi:hypothetical protein